MDWAISIDNRPASRSSGWRTAMRTASTHPRRHRKEERALVRRMISGEESAFEQFCEDYIPIMYRFVQRRLRGDQELTREVVQTAVCKILSKLSSFRGEAALATWLCACCRNEIAAHFRSNGRSIRAVELGDEEIAAEAGLHPAITGGPEHNLLRKESAELVHIALDSLPPHYGKALEWKYLENLSVKEIAARLGLGPKAAESLLTRARQSFRRGYEKLVAGVSVAGVGTETANPRTAVEP